MKKKRKKKNQAPLPWDSPGKNTGVRCNFPLQRIFLAQGSNSTLLVFCIAGWFFTTESPAKPVINRYCCCSVAQSCLTLCNPMDCSTPVFLSFTISRSLLKLRSIESVMPSHHLILYCPLLHLPSIFLRIRIFSNESPLKFFEFCFLELSRKKFFLIFWSTVGWIHKCRARRYRRQTVFTIN